MLLMMMWPRPHMYRKHIEEHQLKTNNSKAVIFRINTVTKIRNLPEKCISQSTCLRVGSAFHPNLNIIHNS